MISLEPPYRVSRHYLEGTNVLITRLVKNSGILEITDCMPLCADADDPNKIIPYHSILRKVHCVEGNVEVKIALAPRFEYASFTPRFRATSPYTHEVVGGADALWVTCTRSLDSLHERIFGRWKLREGQSEFIEAAYSESFVEKKPNDHPGREQLEERLQQTVDFWKNWSGSMRYNGLHRDLVERSALTLKALTYAPTGAIVAAPTTSLPEEIGGERNWDYRYTWIRDTTLTLISLMVTGYRYEADEFRRYLRRTSAGRPQDLRIMYGIRGNRALPEVELSHLSGHRGSAPVRIGNGAADQKQLDIYGQMLEAIYLYHRIGGTITPTNWQFMTRLADIVADSWREPDQGIWEVRDEPRHFVHSKLNTWMALDRVVKIARERRLKGPVGRWARERDNIKDYLMNAAIQKGYFTQAVGYDAADAAVLLVPASGFLPVDHELVQHTIDFIEEELSHDGLVLRYKNDDGLQGHEGAFLLCSFWLLDVYVHSHRTKEAENLLARLVSLANDVGLFAEEADIHTLEGLGNFPQGFTHMALITSLVGFQAAQDGRLPDPGQSYSFAEFALKYSSGI